MGVTAATATLSGSRGSINGTTDSATVILDGLSAALDIALTVTPTTIHEAGVFVCVCCLKRRSAATC